MKLVLIERSIEEITKPNNPPLPGNLIWSTFDYHRRVVVYLVQNEKGIEIPVYVENS